MRIIRSILLSILFSGCIGAHAFAVEYNTLFPVPTDDYIKRFKVCGAYSDIQQFEIGTSEAVLHLKTYSTIVGIRNGKCHTETKTVVNGTNIPLVKSKCNYTDEQRTKFAEKMDSAKTNKLNENLFISAQRYYITNPSVCTIKNYMEN